MTPLNNPGDTIEGEGLLLRQGRIVARVVYLLSIPTQTHFLVNPVGKLNFDYADYITGFLLVPPAEAAQVSPGEYLLQLGDKSKRTIKLERRYKQLEHQGQPYVSFWITLLPAAKP